MKSVLIIRIPVLTLLLSVLPLLAVPVNACSWSYPIWQNRDKNADPYYRFVRDGRMGYIDKTGKIVVQPTLEFFVGNNGDEFQDGLLLTGALPGRTLTVRVGSR